MFFLQVTLQVLGGGYRQTVAPMMTSVLYRRVLIIANGKLKQATRILSNRERNYTWNEIRSYDILYEFIDAHTWMSRWFLCTGRGTQKFIIFSANSVNLLANAYSLSQFVISRHSISPIKSLIIGQLVIIQFLMPIFAAYPLAYCSSLHHSPAKILPKTILCLKKKIGIMVKLKVLTVYERITHGRKYGIKVGPTAIITRSFMFRTLLIYFAYLVNFMKMLSNS